MAPSAADSLSAEPLNLQSGEQIGDYTLCRLIGKGAMADVWLAEEKSLGRFAALKFLRSGERPECVTRFLQEARAAARLDHPNIVRIYKIGEALRRSSVRLFFTGTLRREPIHYIAEEYIPGLNLRQWLDAHGPLSVRQTLQIIAQTATALAAASYAKIVHRDIKPENILLSPAGRIKIVDFGLAAMERSVGTGGDISLTLSGTALGTPLYMSPEQADNRPLDVRSDIYSLGVTAYQMLTGRVPFSGSTPIAVLLAHRIAPLPPLSERRDDIPAPVEDLVRRMLAKEPENRFESADALLNTVRTVWRELNFSPNSANAAPAGSSLTGSAHTGPVYTNPPNSSGAIDLEDDFSIFAADSAEQEWFQLRFDTLESSRILETNFRTWKAQKAKNSLFWGDSGQRRKKIGILFLLLLTAAGLGAAVSAMLFPNLFRQSSIQRFDTVEEQWVFAAQVGTFAAWKALTDYFPNDKTWTIPARQQQARSAMLEGRTGEAHRIFEEFAASSNCLIFAIRGEAHRIFEEFAAVNAPIDQRIFGYAGLAWCLAAEGKIDTAAAMVSELRAGNERTYDRLTEDILSQTTQLIRDH